MYEWDKSRDKRPFSRMKSVENKPISLLNKHIKYIEDQKYDLKSEICSALKYPLKRILMKLFPESAPVQLEFNKVKDLLANYCQTDHARNKALQLRIHTRKEFIEVDLKQSHEYRQLIVNSIYFPNDHVLNLSKELKLISIPGAVLSGEQLMLSLIHIFPGIVNSCLVLSAEGPLNNSSIIGVALPLNHSTVISAPNI